MSELDYVSVIDTALSSLSTADELDRGGQLDLIGSVHRLDGLLIVGAPDAEIEQAISEVNQRRWNPAQQIEVR